MQPIAKSRRAGFGDTRRRDATGDSRIPLLAFLLVGLAFLTPRGLAVEESVALPPVQFTLHAGQVLQRMDGFGVNVTPAQWRGGNLKPALDLLTDDLRCAWVRFDCVGLADWLDPKRRDAAEHYPEAYLREVYTNPVFRDAWATLRYLQTKPGVTVYLNVSGRIPRAMADGTGNVLVDYRAYAQMVASMVAWGREQEKLSITLLDPFNETDLGYPEGPKISGDRLPAAFEAMIAALDAVGLADVQLIGPSDAGASAPRVKALLARSDLAARFRALAVHTYGNNGESQGAAWSEQPTPQAQLVRQVAASAYRAVPLWMNEYGDLDQSGRLEFTVGWRSTKRLLQLIQDGFTGAMAWDAFDNFHEHDAAWATYGLLATDREHWTYAPKSRYYAAKQVYAAVPPGFVHVALESEPRDKNDPYAVWHDPSRHMMLVGFVSPDRNEITCVGLNGLETPTAIEIRLEDMPASVIGNQFYLVTTTAQETFASHPSEIGDDGILRFEVGGHSIFTITTLPVQ